MTTHLNPLKLLASLLIIAGFTSTLIAQPLSKREQKRHEQKVQQSINCSCFIESYDTTFYKGKAQLIIQHGGDYSYNILDTRGDLVLKVRRVRLAESLTESGIYSEYLNTNSPDERAYTRQFFMQGKIVQTVVTNEILKDGKWNDEGWKTFMEINQMPAYHRTAVERGMDAPANAFEEQPTASPTGKVVVAGGEIFQGGKVIGTYTSSQEAFNGVPHEVYKIYDGQGSVASIVKIPGGQETANVYLMKTASEVQYQSTNLEEIVAKIIAAGAL